ncbi:SHOCT domain-containing protein [Undibacterium sp. Ren11W]|uniref:SHOCT domain-containing protein n=1 Tax=Undibacterium sp. Ren11W TaxID=3413045 RepID=UPI003BF28C40
MKKITPLISTLVFLLSACVGAPKVDFANTDSVCAQQCSANHTSCMSGFKLFPLANESSCKTAMETCAQTCPTKAEVAISSKLKSSQPSISERLKDVDALLKDGLISKSEHEAKRQELLKAM